MAIGVDHNKIFLRQTAFAQIHNMHIGDSTDLPVEMLRHFARLLIGLNTSTIPPLTQCSIVPAAGRSNGRS